MSIEIVKQTFMAYAESKKDVAPMATVEDIFHPETEDLVGVRLLFPFQPTIQFIYIPVSMNIVGVLSFPGDNAAITAAVCLEIAAAIQSVLPDVVVKQMGVMAPMVDDLSVTFVVDEDMVHRVYEDAVIQMAQTITANRIKPMN